MIRDLVERNLSRLKLQNHDEVVDIVTRAVGAAADGAVRDLLKRRGIPDPAAAEDSSDGPTYDADKTVFCGGKRARPTTPTE